MKKKIIIFLLLIFVYSLFPNGKKPMKAAALSLFIPGGGQFSNNSYVKSGIVATSEITLLSYAIVSRIKAENYYNDYKISLNNNDYNKYLDYYSKSQNGMWWSATIVFISIVDAYVDAHLYDFEDKKTKIHLKFTEKSLILSWKF